MPDRQRLTIHALGALFATPEQRARWGVTLAMYGKDPGTAPRNMVFHHRNLAWTLKKGERLPVTEQEPRGLRFQGAAVQVYYDGRPVYDITIDVTDARRFEIWMVDMWRYDGLPPETEVELIWPES